MSLQPQAASQALSLYSVASSWHSRSLGNHRARVLADSTAELAWVRLEWRLPGLSLDGVQPVVVDERTGRVCGAHVISASWEGAEILFDPSSHRRHRLPSPFRRLLFFGGWRRRWSRQHSSDLPHGRSPVERSRLLDEEEDGAFEYRKVIGHRPHTEPGCACSGYSSRHGFGAYCKAWESALDPAQTPWCYVSASCALPGVRRGSFGQPHIDCAPGDRPSCPLRGICRD